jgi:hypothetical protein
MTTAHCVGVVEVFKIILNFLVATVFWKLGAISQILATKTAFVIS